MTFAFIFSDVGFGEWFVLLAVILVVVGPKRLPETARKFGSWYSKFRRAADSFKRQLMDMDTEFERAVSEAEKQTTDALSVDQESGTPKPPVAVTDYEHLYDDPAAMANAEQPATQSPGTDNGPHPES